MNLKPFQHKYENYYFKKNKTKIDMVFAYRYVYYYNYFLGEVLTQNKKDK